jgi:hypothetical protein
MRVTEPLNASAFLIDQNRRVRADDLAALRHQLRDLGRRADISAEQDETPRLGLTQKTALVGREREARNAGDESARRHRRRLAVAPAGVKLIRSVPKDNALSTGLLEAVTELNRVITGLERPDHGAIIDTFGTEIGTPDDRLPRLEL